MSRKSGPARGVHGFVRRFLQRPGSADLRRPRRIAAAARTTATVETASAAGSLAALRDRGSWGDGELAQFLALARAAAQMSLDERPFDVQLVAAAAMLVGHVVEMATGEGKTLAGALAAAGYALQSRRVQVISVNDYLARRDAEWMGPLYAELGISFGWIDQWTTAERRRELYRRDVVYVPVNEVGFDVLRDRLVTDLDELVLPEPDVAVVDEADSVLIDSARVPLVLAGGTDVDVADPNVVSTVRRLRSGVHYETDPAGRTVHLTALGLARVERRLGGVDLYTEDKAHTLASVNVALYAHALLRRDVDYLVRDGKVELIDDSRGRVAHLQRWPDGLQAAVEAKEGLDATPAGAVLDRIVVQSLLGRYRTLCGMTGTAMAVAEELHEFYELSVGAVESNEPCIREDLPDRVYLTVEAKEEAIVAHVAAIHETGQPVLLGTQDVAESERLAGALKAAGVECAVLNARNDAEEAAIIAKAGERGRVTISTQMAGRGTDIRLGDGVVELGGLHVVCSGRHETGRLDDQLRGRAGRQGDPGSSLIIASVEDDLVTANLTESPTPGSADENGLIRDSAAADLLTHAQRVAEGAALAVRRTTWRYGLIVDTQRGAVLRHRDLVLRSDRAVKQLEERTPARCAEIREKLGEDLLADAARLIVLAHLDEAWSEHLAVLDDVREGIHLRALARESPLEEFRKIANDLFDPFFETVYERAAATLADADLTEGAIASAGPRRPTSTWTYLVTDDPFGSEADRFLTGLRRPTRRGTGA
ncbi:MAG TPA: accessory Sec system translocase SecA2 [Pseudonocardia sp.]